MSHAFSLRTLRLTGATVLALAGAATAARAADLYDDAPVRHGSAYEDPRYAEIYGRGQPVPHERIYQYDDRGAPDRRADRCPPKDEISRRLERDGWGNFNNAVVIDRDTVTIDARRPNGRPFRLEVDRCNGEILAARPLDQPRYRADADRHGVYDEDERRPIRRY